MVGHEGSSAGSYLADPTSPIPSHCASIVATSTLRVNKANLKAHYECHRSIEIQKKTLELKLWKCFSQSRRHDWGWRSSTSMLQHTGCYWLHWIVGKIWVAQVLSSRWDQSLIVIPSRHSPPKTPPFLLKKTVSSYNSTLFITRGRVLNEELYAQRLQKLIYLICLQTVSSWQKY